MEQKEQTAVEWFFDNLKSHEIQAEHLSMYEKAKEMEKEQMIKFAQEVFRNRYNQISQSLGNIADDIYNETYGGNK
jgi:hypothetical protein